MKYFRVADVEDPDHKSFRKDLANIGQKHEGNIIFPIGRAKIEELEGKQKRK